MAGTVYLLCSGTALSCSMLLFRGFRREGARLLLWCSLFFLSLGLENAMLFFDLILVPHLDLVLLRTPIALIGVVLLLVGLIWDVG